MEESEKSDISRFINIEKPYFLVPIFAVISFILFWLGILFFSYSKIAEIYWYAFSVILALIFTYSVYSSESFRSIRVYVGSIILFYSLLIFIGTMPGYYMAKLLPDVVNQAGQTITAIRTGYTTVFSMSIAIFLNNAKIDIVSFIPFIGPFVLGIAIINTSSVVWGLSFSELFSNNPYWFLGPFAVVIAPDTFTEFSSYILSMIGGLYLFRALAFSGSESSEPREKLLIKAFLYLAASLALLYASAVLEAFLIIRFGL